MRLKDLYIHQYRVLKGLTLDFERGRHDDSRPNPQLGYTLDFLAGVNGTGKSTVLRLLARVFARLETDDYEFPVPIRLTYTLSPEEGGTKSTEITITNMPDEETAERSLSKALRFKVDGENEWKRSQMPPALLPRHIVIYTTGNEAEWARVVLGDESQDSASDAFELSLREEERTRELPGHRHQESRPDDEDTFQINDRLLFIHADRLPLVSLCGLIASHRPAREGSSSALRPVLESLDIEHLAAFSLRVRAHRSLTHPTQWEIIERLEAVADRIVQQGADRLFVFDMGEQQSRQSQDTIFGIYPSPIELFRRLNALYEHRPFYDPPLQEVNLFLRRRFTDPSSLTDEGNETPPSTMLHLFDWLSDGEQSFLGRMALFALFQADNLLILLDEPEVHFNDVWKREIVNMLDQIMRGYSSHALITTHSSIALTDVQPKDLLILRREGQYTHGDGGARPPNFETFGADPSDILVHVFGTPSASGAHSVRFIREMLGRSNSQSDLDRLERMVAPGYWRYRIQLERSRLAGQPA